MARLHKNHCKLSAKGAVPDGPPAGRAGRQGRQGAVSRKGEEIEMRWSNNEYDESGDLVHGFDYDLQVWVEDGVIVPPGSGYDDNPGWIGREWKKVKREWLEKGVHLELVWNNIPSPFDGISANLTRVVK